MRALVVKGDWWLPGKKDQKIRGELHFSEEEGPRLTLDSCGNVMPNETDIILGLTDNKEKITLYDCYMQWPGSSNDEYESEYMFRGVHFEDIPHFSRIEFQSEILSQWVNIDGFTHRNDVALRPNESAIFYKKPEDIILCKWDGCTYSLVFKLIQTTTGGPDRKQEFQQKVYFRLDFEEEVILSSVERLTRALMNMLTFTADRPVYSSEMIGYSSVTGKAPIEIYLKQHVKSHLTREKLRPRLLFQLTDTRDQAPEFLEKWMELSLGPLSPFTNNYIAEKYIPLGFVERGFLEYVRCLEVYHRKTSERKAIPKEEFERRCQLIVREIRESKIKRWVKGKLKHADELTLQDRLQEITGKYRYNIELFSDRAVQDFCKRIADERHYLTHFEEKKDQERLTLIEMIELTDQMKKLIDICILTSLGFDQDFIDTLFYYEIPFDYKIMAVRNYIDSKKSGIEQDLSELKEDAEYLLMHCTNGTNVLLTLCNRPNKIEKYKANIVVLESIGILKRTVEAGRERYMIREEYEKYVYEYYREKKKKEERR